MTGYGIVEPRLDEMELQEPEVFKQGRQIRSQDNS